MTWHAQAPARDRGALGRGHHAILDTADKMAEISARPMKKVPALRAKLVVNLFFENSTRTRSSFEIAEKRPERRHPQLLARAPPP